MTKELIDELICICNDKFEHLNIILELTKKQKKVISLGDMDKVDFIIDSKDKEMKKIDKLNTDFIMKFSQIKKENNISDINELDAKLYPNLKQLKSIVKEITSTLLAISMIDKKNNEMIKNKFQDIKLNLRKIKKGKKAYKGYNKNFGGSIFIDKKE